LLGTKVAFIFLPGRGRAKGSTMIEQSEAVVQTITRPRAWAQRGRRGSLFPCPESPSEVAEALAAYLEPRLKVGPLAYAEEPRPIPHGWEAHIYSFRIDTSAPPPPRFGGSFILNLYCGAGGTPGARHEFAAQRHLRELGYDVPDALLLEDDCSHLGGPFLIMECVPGPT